jgi:hypothetical protein
MALRFRKRLKLAPGLRLNVSGSGLSLSAGPRGASLTIGNRGLYSNVGLPGSGFYARQRLDGPQRSAGTARDRQSKASGDFLLGLRDDGSLVLSDPETREPLPSRFMKQLQDEQGDWVRKWLAEQCNHWNQGIDDVLNLHLRTPSPSESIAFSPESFTEDRPIPPTPRKLGFLGNLFQSRYDAIMKANELAETEHREAMARWEEGLCALEAKEEARRKLIDGRLSNPEAMQEFLSQRLEAIEWPRETLVDFEVQDDGGRVMLDVDLPEIEDLPSEQATVATRGFKINVKARSDAQRRREYMTHIHGICFRLIGETFVALPIVETVVVSGYSQRLSKATGHIADEYLLSVRVCREGWEGLNFDNLAALDVAECLGSFDIRRKMTPPVSRRCVHPEPPDTIVCSQPKSRLRLTMRRYAWRTAGRSRSHSGRW